MPLRNAALPKAHDVHGGLFEEMRCLHLKRPDRYRVRRRPWERREARTSWVGCQIAQCQSRGNLPVTPLHVDRFQLPKHDCKSDLFVHHEVHLR